METANEGERPTTYADRLGRHFIMSTPNGQKKKLGQYLSAVPVAEFMARAITVSGVHIRILDPGAGAGILSCALSESMMNRRVPPRIIEVEAYEVDPYLQALLKETLSYTATWLNARGVEFRYIIKHDDFVLANRTALARLGNLNGTLQEKFDVAIGNPPYFKLNKKDTRSQAAAAVIHGQPNIYSLFMAISASMLKRGGILCFITPRSYASGPYFAIFRKIFFGMMRPRTLHLFGSRKKAFSKDGVLQENVILIAERLDGWAPSNGPKVEVSFSEGIDSLLAVPKRTIAVSEIMNTQSVDAVLRIPMNKDHDEVIRIVDRWKCRLADFGLEISTGPVVPFRTREICNSMDLRPGYAPLLWMQNVKNMQIQWPIERRTKGQLIKVNERSRGLLLPNRNYTLLRRFSAKEETRRLVAAPWIGRTLETPSLGVENHLNYIHRPGGSLTDDEVYGLATLLNSAILDTYFRISNGNTQVSATEIRSMPFPPLTYISELGRRVRSISISTDSIASIINDVIGISFLPDDSGVVVHG